MRTDGDYISREKALCLIDQYYGPSLKHRGYQVFLDQNKKKINAIAWMKIPRYKTEEEK